MSELFLILKITTIILIYCFGVAVCLFVLCQLTLIFNKLRADWQETRDDRKQWNHGKCRICGAQYEKFKEWEGSQFSDGYRVYKCTKNEKHPHVFIQHAIEKAEDFEQINKEKE